MVVSRDLSFFDHVHPITQPDGSLSLDYIFPNGGEYLLYSDITPEGDANQVFRIPISVSGTGHSTEPLVESSTWARLIGEDRIELGISPNPAKAGDETNLRFTLSRDGNPTTDLEPFLGAGGHCVILSEDTQTYLHSHPVERPSEAPGSEVSFHTRFPAAGLYKLWGQFQRAGKIITADFVIRVR